MSAFLGILGFAALFVVFCLFPPRGGHVDACHGCAGKEDPEGCGGCPLLGNDSSQREEVEIP